MQIRPEVGRSIVAAGLVTNYHEMGNGPPLLLLHGSGPGVSAWANWNRAMAKLASDFRVIAPDIAGFGFTERPSDDQYNIKLWVGHVIGLLDALGIASAVVVGNSFGGGVALAASLRHAERFAGMVLMGTPAGEFPQTEGLAAGWYYEPSLENMERMLQLFPHDKTIITAEMVRTRYEVSVLSGGQAAVRKLQPRPAPPGEHAIVKGVPADALRTIRVPTLVLHGREDRVVPMQCAMTILDNVPDCEAHVFGRCGHWVQAEKEDAFLRLVSQFAATHLGESNPEGRA